MADIPGNMQPAWDFIAKLKEQEPLLGEDPDFTTWFQNGEIDVACTISTNAREAKKNGIDVSLDRAARRAPRSTPTACGSPRACRRTSSTGRRSTSTSR